MSKILNPEEQKVIDKFEVISSSNNYIRARIVLNSALQRELYEELYKKYSAEVEVKGFRKGMAPREMIEPKIYQKIVNEVVSTLVYSAVGESLQHLDEDILVVGAPIIDKINYTMIESPIEIEVKLYITPKFSLPDFNKFRVSKEDLRVEVSEEQVKQALEDFFKQWKEKNPKSQHTESNDEWASSLGIKGVKKVNDLKKHIKGLIQEDMRIHKAQHVFEEKVMQIIEAIDLQIPDEVVEREVERAVKQQEESISKYGISLDQYLEYYKKSKEEFIREIKKGVLTRFKLDLFWAVVIKEWGIKLERDDAEYVQLALSQFGVGAQGLNDPRILVEASRVALLLKAQDQLAVKLGIGEIYKPLLHHTHVHVSTKRADSKDKSEPATADEGEDKGGHKAKAKSDTKNTKDSKILIAEE